VASTSLFGSAKPTVATARRVRFYGIKDLDRMPQLQRLPAWWRQSMSLVAQVLPFRTNNYVVDELIDWERVPDDPIFQLTFPQPDMLSPEHRLRMSRAAEARAAADEIRLELNPHPSGQLTHNVPTLDGHAVPGVQHKYRETCLVFPSAGQTCHAYCTFCFRWPQFTGTGGLRFATDESMRFHAYLAQHREVTDVLITGGDPLVMSAERLARYVEPLLTAELSHVQSIRIGTKALAYWPYRLLTDGDSDDLLRLLERVPASGRHLAIMAHFDHWRELSTPAVQAAIRRLQSVGAVIRTQAPLVRHVNDDSRVWARLWKDQVRLGLVPYYLFVERDTGASRYFAVPLARALAIYRDALTRESGLGRTARGPVMSALPGKVVVEGTLELGGRALFVLSFLQARNPDWCRRPFLAELDESATWLTDLRPAFGAEEFFFERELREMAA
jgi:KamA family protein